MKTNDRETWESAPRGWSVGRTGPSRANVGDDGGEGEGGGGDGVTRGGARDDANGWDGEKGGTEGGDGGDGGERWRGERWATGDGMDDVGGFRERARANERWWRGDAVEGRREAADAAGGGRGGEAGARAMATAVGLDPGSRIQIVLAKIAMRDAMDALGVFEYEEDEDT